MKTFKPLFLFVSVLLVVGMACLSSGGGGDPPSQPEQPSQPQATQPPAVQPTAIPPTETPPPTEVPPTVSEFFTEEFDQDPNWNYFLTNGDEDKAQVEFANSLMTFNLTDTAIFAYYIYEDFEYRDVRLDIRAENRGKNNNNVSLVCRYSDEGWYEFSTEGGGVWYLLAGTTGSDGKVRYDTIVDGGALALKQGKEVNEYGMVCQGNEITLYINGVEVRKVQENQYSFREGNVGFNISSLNVYPIIVEVDWFKISEP